MPRLSAFACIIAAALLALAPAPVPAQETGEKIGTIRLGYRTDAPPFSSERDGVLEGYSFDLCLAVAEHLAVVQGLDAIDASVYRVTAADRFDKLIDKQIQILCGASTITLERRAFMGFSLPILIDGVGFAVIAGAPAPVAALAGADKSLEELLADPVLSGMKIGVLGATTTEAFLDASGLAEATLGEVVTFANHEEALGELANGTYDLYFGSRTILKGFASDGAPIVVSDSLLTREPIALGLPRDDPDLALAVDTALSDLYLKGGIVDIYVGHFGEIDEETLEFFRNTALR